MTAPRNMPLAIGLPAGQTVRVNAGGTDLESYTPAGGAPAVQGTYTMFSTGVAAVAAGALIMDLWNADAPSVIRVLEVFAWCRNSAAVAGVRVPVELRRTTSQGSGGGGITAGIFDTNDTALPAGITARTAPSGGAAATGGFLGGGRVNTEEGALGTATSVLAPWFQSQSPIYVNDGLTARKRLVVRNGQGLRVDIGANIAGAGLVAAGITFHVGAVGSDEQPTYSWQANSVATATKNMLDIWNGSGSNKVLTITRIVAYARPTGAAITGTVITLEGYRTSSIGTGGAGITADNYDSDVTLGDPAPPAQITARDAPTGGAVQSGGALFAETLGTDETSDSEFRADFRRKGGVGHNTQYVLPNEITRRPIVIRENQGFIVRTGPLSGVGNVVVIVEGTLT